MGIIDAKISSKGQVTIPAEIRKLIGLEIGGKVQFQFNDNGQVHIAAKNRSIKELKGLVARPKKTVDVKAAIIEAVTKRDARAAKS